MTGGWFKVRLRPASIAEVERAYRWRGDAVGSRPSSRSTMPNRHRHPRSLGGSSTRCGPRRPPGNHRRRGRMCPNPRPEIGAGGRGADDARPADDGTGSLVGGAGLLQLADSGAEAGLRQPNPHQQEGSRRRPGSEVDSRPSAGVGSRRARRAGREGLVCRRKTRKRPAKRGRDARRRATAIFVRDERGEHGSGGVGTHGITGQCGSAHVGHTDHNGRGPGGPAVEADAGGRAPAPRGRSRARSRWRARCCS